MRSAIAPLPRPVRGQFMKAETREGVHVSYSITMAHLQPKRGHHNTIAIYSSIYRSEYQRGRWPHEYRTYSKYTSCEWSTGSYRWNSYPNISENPQIHCEKCPHEPSDSQVIEHVSNVYGNCPTSHHGNCRSEFTRRGLENQRGNCPPELTDQHAIEKYLAAPNKWVNIEIASRLTLQKLLM